MNIARTIYAIGGKPIYEISRIDGEMPWAFFLRIGDSDQGRSSGHGQFSQKGWRFIFDACGWRILQEGIVVVGSYDDEDFIDRVFSTLKLGSVGSMEIVTIANDLRITFSSGMRLETFAMSAIKDYDFQWCLSDPNDETWIQNKNGKLYLSDG